MQFLSRVPLFWKVLAPAILSLLCLLAYLLMSSIVTQRNNAEVASIRDEQFPRLEAMTENVAALDKLISTLNTAAASADADTLAGAGEVAQQIRARYQKLSKITPGDAALKRLSADFETYYQSAHGVAKVFVDGGEVNPDDVQAMSTALATYRDRLNAERDAANKRFTATVGDSVAASNRALVFGLVVGVFALLAALGVGIVLARAISAALGRAMSVANHVAAGRLDDTIVVEGVDENARLMKAMKHMQSELRAFVEAQQEMATRHREGQIDHRMPADRFAGIYGNMANAINALVATHIDVNLRVVEVVGTYARGDLSVDIERLPGQGARITQAVDSVKHGMESINAQIRQLVDAAVAGDFSRRGDASRFEFAYRDTVDSLNRLMATSEQGLNEVGSLLAAVADGDLGRRVDVALPGQFGRLAADANHTVGQLAQVVGRIREGADTINSAASEIAAGNSDLSNRTESQAASLEETASSIEELTSTVRQNADNARQANALAITASEVATRGGDVVHEVVATMSQISASSSKIADIIGVIDGIAFQTNILALNAAVEAARAGEQGRGFAVVASEVRSLAQRSANAAKEIKVLIGDSVERVGTGTRLVESAGRTMDEIVGSVKRVGDIIAEISAASQEQSAGIEQVNQAIAQMDESTQQNAALVEQASAAARSMEEQAGELMQTVAAFRLSASAPPYLRAAND
ncbi:methyl-accepting chemotaxis protein [Lysobacter auxotrophicus]|uniref:Methyl-accepting chemotaxis protein n=1 Tax=Lysobacter auxotrophicus TaxID=2992573 RepID=A0ABM8DGZ2_9GAMM|nr:methyl-accepting chemotaxis protein [Lysobacter auxotrophicus]BDU17883.1 methyl-accepting chemotaxis protein [Lysobacter auxotrophicus]